MNEKKNRQALIQRIVRENEISTQDGLLEKLKECGIEVTQATVSRDLRELGLSKKNGRRGQVNYAVAETVGADAGDASKFRRIIREAFVSAEKAGTILVIRTVGGMAMAVGAAVEPCRRTKRSAGRSRRLRRYSGNTVIHCHR